MGAKMTCCLLSPFPHRVGEIGAYKLSDENMTPSQCDIQESNPFGLDSELLNSYQFYINRKTLLRLSFISAIVLTYANIGYNFLRKSRIMEIKRERWKWKLE